MSRQSQQILEEQLLIQLQKLGYKFVALKDEAALLTKLKSQSEKHNNFILSDKEFNHVLYELSKGSVFEKAKTLRGKLLIRLDNGDTKHIELLKIDKWRQNHYHVIYQVT